MQGTGVANTLRPVQAVCSAQKPQSELACIDGYPCEPWAICVDATKCIP